MSKVLTYFTICDSNNFAIYSNNGVPIPQRDNPEFPYLAKRCDACKALGIFRSKENEFLLCYNGNYILSHFV